MSYPRNKREPHGTMTLRILSEIKRISKAQGFPPTVRQLMDAVGLSSPDTVQYHIEKLREAGNVTKNYGKRARTLLVKS